MVATNLAYPATDLLLLIIVLGVLVSFDWRPPPAVWLLGLGVAGFAVVDTIFLLRAAGAAEYLTKPFEVPELLALVDRLTADARTGG